MSRCTAVFLLLFCASTAMAQVDITYLGNEGLMLRSADFAILIDALHGPYKSYAAAPAPIRARLQRGENPYHGIDLVLVSHVHADHFDAGMVASHLQNNRRARLVSSPQVVEAVLERLPQRAEARKRVQAVLPPAGGVVSVAVAPKVELSLIGLPHGGRRWAEMQNLGHLIEIGGVRVLHIGDADSDGETFAKARLTERSIDAALLPDWYLAYADGQRLIREHIRARRLFAVHVMDDSVDEVTPRIRKAFPAATVLTRIGTTFEIARR